MGVNSMKKDINCEIGQRIKDIRKNVNMNQEEMASFCNITKQALCHIENGKNSLTIENLITICNIMGVSADYILFNKVDNNQSAQYKRIEQIFSKYPKEELNRVLKIINEIIAC